jgi:adenine-specific DNA methylase
MGALQPDRKAYKMKIGNNGSVKGIFLFFLFIAAIYVGVSFSKPYYRAFTLGSHTRDFLKTDIGNIQAIRNNVMNDAKELKVPLNEKDLEVFVVNKIIKVKAKWSETVDFWGYYQKELDFSMQEEY